AVRRFDFQATARPPQAEPISGKGTVGSAFLSPSRPDQPPPVGRPEFIGKPCFPTEFIDLLFMDNQASEAQPTSRRNLQRAVEVRGSTTGPFIASAPSSKVENFGIGQNTGETLPKFRQKSKRNLKRN
ncbi:hypothetical protein Prudu_269S000100, partial [Prunus dulcis]